MTTIIEQADAIVGMDFISIDALACVDPDGMDTYRRGAYASWYAKNSQPDQWPTVAETLVSQAERIVRLHKPKGDGLPDIEFHARNDMCGFVDVVACAKVPCSIDETGRLLKRLNEFNSPPVRRMLSAFEVVEPGTEVINAPMTALFDKQGKGICWLVPRGER